MNALSIFLKTLFFSLLIFCSYNIYADGHGEKKAPELEYFGTLSYADITRINDFKRNFIADIHTGTLTLANGDKGKIASPCADYGNVQKERSLDLDVKCSITMEDGSELYLFYGGKQIMDEKSDQLIKDGKTLTPKNGIDYWISAPLIRTSSEKYDYLSPGGGGNLSKVEGSSSRSVSAVLIGLFHEVASAHI